MVEAVRILAGEATTATLNLTLDDIDPVLVGTLQLDVSEDLQNPIAIAFSGAQPSPSVGTDMRVTVNPTIAPDSYQWYLNGAFLSGEESQSITIGASLAEENYRLGLVITKDTILSSADVPFR